MKFGTKIAIYSLFGIIITIFAAKSYDDEKKTFHCIHFNHDCDVVEST